MSETSEEFYCRVGIDVPGRGQLPSKTNRIGRSLPLSKEEVKRKGICPKFQDARNQMKQPKVGCRSSIVVCSKGIMRRGLLHEEYEVNDVVQYAKDKEPTSVATDKIDKRDDAAEMGEVAIEKVMGKEISLLERLNAY